MRCFHKEQRLMQDINEVIEMFPVEKGDEVLRSAESRLKKENAGAGTDLLVCLPIKRHYQ